jgi:hypothetical protein
MEEFDTEVGSLVTARKKSDLSIIDFPLFEDIPLVAFDLNSALHVARDDKTSSETRKATKDVHKARQTMRHRWGTYLIHSTNTGNGWSYCFTNLTIHETAHGEKRVEEEDDGGGGRGGFFHS